MISTQWYGRLESRRLSEILRFVKAETDPTASRHATSLFILVGNGPSRPLFVFRSP